MAWEHQSVRDYAEAAQQGDDAEADRILRGVTRRFVDYEASDEEVTELGRVACQIKYNRTR